MSIQEKSKESSSKVIKKSEDKNLGIVSQDSQKDLAKKSGSKETLKSQVKSCSENKINQPELGTRMSTRSAKAASNDIKTTKSNNKNVMTVKGHSQQESSEKSKLSQRKLVRETPKASEQLNRRSQRLQQLSEVSTRSLRSREIQGQVQAVKQSVLLTRKEHCNSTQSKPNKVKTSQKHVKRKVLERKSDSKEDGNSVINEVINSPKGKKRRVEQQIACTCSSQCIQGSEKCLQKTTRNEETKCVPVTSSEIKRSKVATSEISKKNQMKSVHTQVNTNAKSQKSPQPSVPEQSIDNELEQAGKSKRGSILQLCEEIAGEIESDTVEVKKESSQMENVKEMPTEIKLEETNVERQILHQKETNQDVPCSRFFPSRKTKPVKCILNGMSSSAKKNSNWTKIKLSKFNSVQQNKSDTQVSPKLGLLRASFSPPSLEIHHSMTHSTFLGTKTHDKNIAGQQNKMEEINSEEVKVNDITVEIKAVKRAPKNCHLDNQIKSSDPPLENQMKHCFEPTPNKNFSLCLESKLENNLVENTTAVSTLLSQARIDTGESKFPGSAPKQHNILDNQTPKNKDNRETPPNHFWPKCNSHLEITIPKDLKLKEAEKADEKQLIIDAGQKRFGAVSCNICGMLYTASNPEDETQHLLFHNQFISAVKYVIYVPISTFHLCLNIKRLTDIISKINGDVIFETSKVLTASEAYKYLEYGWKKERILAEYPDGRIIMVLPEDPKYALKKVDEIREMVDNDLGFQQAPLMCYSRTKTLLFISNDKKVVGCLIAEHIQWGYRVIEEKLPVIRSEEEKVRFERQKAWCCSTLPEPAICGISRIWVFSMMRRKKIASRMIECLRSNFIYGSYLSKEEIAFSDPTPDGKLFATQYCGTGQFLVYNFINGQNTT